MSQECFDWRMLQARTKGFNGSKNGGNNMDLSPRYMGLVRALAGRMTPVTIKISISSVRIDGIPTSVACSLEPQLADGLVCRSNMTATHTLQLLGGRGSRMVSWASCKTPRAAFRENTRNCLYMMHQSFYTRLHKHDMISIPDSGRQRIDRGDRRHEHKSTPFLSCEGG